MRITDKKKLAEFSSSQRSSTLSDTRVYKKYSRVYINADYSLFEILYKGIDNSEIPIFPKKNIKLWLLWILQSFGLKKNLNKIEFREISGLALSWIFLKKTEIPINARVIFIKKRFFIIIVKNKKDKYVVKLCRIEEGIERLKNEIASLKIAGEINLTNIRTPCILDSNYESPAFVKMEFVPGKNLALSKAFTKEKAAIVSDFMVAFYNKSGLRYVSLKESNFKPNRDAVEYISSRKGGEEMINRFKTLFDMDNKLFWTRIHGDLGFNNILVDSRGKIKLIDWEKSKEYFLVKDLKNPLFDNESTYEKVLKRSDLPEKNLYTYNQQLFIVGYLDVFSFTTNAIVRGRLHPRNKHKIDASIQSLIEMTI